MKNKAAFAVLIISLLALISGCGSKSPAFTGYIYSKDEQHGLTVVVGLSSGGSGFSDVLIRDGVSKLEVGSLVEVYYTKGEINLTFPTSTRARLIEIETPKQEKEVIRLLFEHIDNEYGKNVYPAIAGVEEKSDHWAVDVNLISVEMNNEIEGISGFTLSKNDSHIEAIKQ